MFCSPLRRGGFSPQGSGRMPKLVKPATSPISILLSEDFARIFIHNEEYLLKIEFVNDVLFHTGEIQSANFLVSFKSVYI